MGGIIEPDYDDDSQGASFKREVINLAGRAIAAALSGHAASRSLGDASFYAALGHRINTLLNVTEHLEFSAYLNAICDLAESTFE